MLCERLHVLPNEGGLLDQDETHINRLTRLYELIDDYREDEIERKSKS
jgi:hypothetical protein